ncbi:hypothetical protein HJC23_004325 [Cyclotella cryptica]|uniref:Uncharacterized protein n=1 Tax=Cyclotella cryptica TaxID=29204 RepID=A0ABD3Q379_9STRA
MATFFAFRTNPPAVPPSKSASAISMTIFSTLTPASRPHSLPASNNDSRAFRMMDLPCPKLQNGHGLRYDPDHADMNCRYVAPNLAWAECEVRESNFGSPPTFEEIAEIAALCATAVND